MAIVIGIMSLFIMGLCFFSAYILSELRDETKRNADRRSYAKEDMDAVYEAIHKIRGTAKNEEVITMLGGSVHKCYDKKGYLISVRIEAPWLDYEIRRELGGYGTVLYSEGTCNDALKALGRKIGQLNASAKNPPTKKKA